MGRSDVRISVIVPVYRVEGYLPRCLGSLAAQEQGGAEFIVVDDGSPDGSGGICDRFAGEDPRFRVIHSPNAGVSVARNTGIQAATGDYLVFLDGDDWLHDGALSAIAGECRRTGPDILIGDYFAEFEGRSSRESFFSLRGGRTFAPGDRECLVRNCLLPDGFGNPKATANVGVPWAKAYRRGFVEGRGARFVPGLRRMQDTIFNMHCLYAAETVVYAPVPLCHYRKTAGSATAKYDPLFDETAERILAEIRRFIGMHGADWLERDYHTKAVELFCEWVRLSVVPPESGLDLDGMARTMSEMAKGPRYAQAIARCDLSKLGRAGLAGALLWRAGAWRAFAWSYGRLRAMRNGRLYGAAPGGAGTGGVAHELLYGGITSRRAPSGGAGRSRAGAARWAARARAWRPAAGRAPALAVGAHA